jgi:hypothetical protein
MKRILFAFMMSLIGLSPLLIHAEDPFFVHLEDAVPQGKGKVLLLCIVENKDAAADIVSLDVTLQKDLTIETAELHKGWGHTKLSAQAFRMHTAGNLRPKTQGKFRVIIRGNLDIFRGRTTEPLMVVTATYGNGLKRTFEVGAPVMRDAR